jgi:hypothetical protein
MSLIGARGGVLGAAGGAAAVEPDYWEMTVETPSDAATWSVQVLAGTTPDLNISWGDATSDTTANSVTTYDHEYATAGTYTVRISGTFASGGRIRLGKTGNFAYLKTVQPVGGITGISNFQDSMRDCTGLTSLPANLFRWHPTITANAFRLTFSGCTALSSLPDDLFRYNTEVTSDAFNGTFFNCTSLTSIPTDLFRYNTKVSTLGFAATFRNTRVVSIPTNLFRYNTLVSSNGFERVFSEDNALTSLPTDLFRYNVNVSTSGFTNAFKDCTALASVPALLFKYNTACTSFSSVFQNCNKLQLRADLFFDTGEASTRFLDQSVNFADAMRIGTFTGTQGTAPALWDCTFGTGTPTTTTCFTGHTTSSVTNHADIPTPWGGPA